MVSRSPLISACGREGGKPLIVIIATILMSVLTGKSAFENYELVSPTNKLYRSFYLILVMAKSINLFDWLTLNVGFRRRVFETV